MASQKQRAAARRNIKKAASAAKRKRTLLGALLASKLRRLDARMTSVSELQQQDPFVRNRASAYEVCAEPHARV